MKLLTIQTHREGEEYPRNSLISIGRMYESGRGYNGFYVQFTSPFTHLGPWTNPNNFENVENTTKRRGLRLYSRRIRFTGPRVLHHCSYCEKV